MIFSENRFTLFRTMLCNENGRSIERPFVFIR